MREEDDGAERVVLALVDKEVKEVARSVEEASLAKSVERIVDEEKDSRVRKVFG